MTNRKKESRFVIGIGELLWDCFPTYRRMGGAPANFAYHVSQFGFDSVVISAVGNDKEGEDLIKELKLHHLDYCVEKVDLPTGTVDVNIANVNDPQYIINTEVAWSAIPYSDKLAAMAKKCCAVCFGTLAQYGSRTRETIGMLVDSVPLECYKVYDVNLRKSAGKALFSNEIILSSISRCNVLKLNADELDYVTELFSLNKEESIELRGRRLMALCPNVKILIVTMGTDGSLVFCGKETSFMGTPKVVVKDAVGAGDSFTGAFIGSILDGKTFKEAHRIAVNVSAYVCTQLGAMPVVPEINSYSK